MLVTNPTGLASGTIYKESDGSGNFNLKIKA